MGILKEGFLRGLTYAIGGFVCQEYVGGLVICAGPSMKPNIITNDIFFTDEITPRWGTIKTGDVVIARSPKNFHSICKRVVAVAGDNVYFSGKQIVIPKGHVWLEGDNKDDSTDSRDWGPLPLPMVRRKLIFKIWPSVERKGLVEPVGGIYAAAAKRNEK